MTNNLKCPHIPQNIVSWLNEFYPEVILHPDQELGAVMYFAGQRSVVKLIERKAVEQEENELIIQG